MVLLRKLNKVIHEGTVKNITVDEQIAMSGLLAEAAASWFFSDFSKSYLKMIRYDLFEACMETSKNIIENPTKDNLQLMLNIWPDEDIWVKIQDAYIQRITKEKEEPDDKDVIGEY